MKKEIKERGAEEWARVKDEVNTINDNSEREDDQMENTYKAIITGATNIQYRVTQDRTQQEQKERMKEKKKKRHRPQKFLGQETGIAALSWKREKYFRKIRELRREENKEKEVQEIQAKMKEAQKEIKRLIKIERKEGIGRSFEELDELPASEAKAWWKILKNATQFKRDFSKTKNKKLKAVRIRDPQSGHIVRDAACAKVWAEATKQHFEEKGADDEAFDANFAEETEAEVVTIIRNGSRGCNDHTGK